MRRLLSWTCLLALPLAHAQEDPRRTIAIAREEERGILDELNDYDRRLHELQGRFDALTEQEAALDATRTRHEDELAAATAALDAQRADVGTRLSALYRLQRRGLARLIFGAEDPVELRRRSMYLGHLVEADRARIREYAQNLDRKRTFIEQVDRDRNALGAVRADLRLKEAELREDRARRLTLLDDIRTKRELALRALAERASTGREIGGFLGATSGGSETVTSANFRKQFGKLPWPTTGTLLRSFGASTDPVTGQVVSSEGIDIAAPYGTPFRAVFGGTVKNVDFYRGYGQTVVVEHGAYATLYAHANGVHVRPGQTVHQGDLLGIVGNTGLTHGASHQLTFEIRYHDTAQDPLPWLRPR